MSWFGTDMVALGCILGGAAVSGTLTAAMLQGGEQAESRCAVEAMAVSPRIAVSHGGRAHTIVVTPDVRVHAVRGCEHRLERIVEINMDAQLEQLDAQLEHLDRALEIELRQLEGQLEAGLEQRVEAQIQFEEAMRQVDAARVKVVVQQPGGGTI